MEFEKVQQIVSEQLGITPEEITMEASFVNDLGADSLDLVEMIMSFEEAFNREIPDDVAEKIQTVGDAVELLKAMTE